VLYHAEILARDEEGVMERILRVFRHRGYSTRSLRATCDQEQNLIHIEIEGDSERPLSQLSLQIEKLCAAEIRKPGIESGDEEASVCKFQPRIE
jgi:acetolactate synthase II small subunit